MFSQQTRHITSKSAHLAATARTHSISTPLRTESFHLSLSSKLYGNSCLQVGAPSDIFYAFVNKNGFWVLKEFSGWEI
jgi:hypothetical protein